MSCVFISGNLCCSEEGLVFLCVVFEGPRRCYIKGNLSLKHIAVNLFGFEVGMWCILAMVTAPISFLKQVVSVVQLVVACRDLGALDVVIRARQT